MPIEYEFTMNMVQISSELIELLTWLDYDCPAAEREAAFQSLDTRVQSALDELWEKYYARPKSNGRWSGEECDSVWIPDDDYTPPNKHYQYNNLYNLNWGELKKKYSIDGIAFCRGRVVFDNLAIHSIQIPDFAEFIDSNIRTGLHEEAFRRLAQKLGCSVKEIKELKEGQPVDCSWQECDSMTHVNYAWHEDIDCETLYLVPQEIHGNIIHFGGVAMCQLLRKHGLI